MSFVSENLCLHLSKPLGMGKSWHRAQVRKARMFLMQCFPENFISGLEWNWMKIIEKIFWLEEEQTIEVWCESHLSDWKTFHSFNCLRHLLVSAMCQADSNKNLKRRMNSLLSLEGNLTGEGKQKAKNTCFSRKYSLLTRAGMMLLSYGPTDQHTRPRKVRLYFKTVSDPKRSPKRSQDQSFSPSSMSFHQAAELSQPEEGAFC